MKVVAVTCSSYHPEDGSEEKWGWMAAGKAFPVLPPGWGEPWEWGFGLTRTPVLENLGMEGFAAWR